MERKARAAGKAFAQSQLESEAFRDWVVDAIHHTDVDDLPRTKKEALRIAGHVLTDFRHELERQASDRSIAQMLGVNEHSYWAERHGTSFGELSREFRGAFADVFARKTVRGWLADEIMFRVSERVG